MKHHRSALATRHRLPIALDERGLVVIDDPDLLAVVAGGAGPAPAPAPTPAPSNGVCNNNLVCPANMICPNGGNTGCPPIRTPPNPA